MRTKIQGLLFIILLFGFLVALYYWNYRQKIDEQEEYVPLYGTTNQYFYLTKTGDIKCSCDLLSALDADISYFYKKK
jgi:hypothetical protein